MFAKIALLRRKHLVIGAISILAFAIAVISGVVIHERAEQRLLGVKQGFEDRIASIEVPEMVDLGINERGEYNKEVLEEQRSGIESILSELEAIQQEIQKHPVLDGEEEIQRGLIGLIHAKIGGLKDLSEALDKEESRAQQLALEHQKELERKEREEKERKEREERERKEREERERRQKEEQERQRQQQQQKQIAQSSTKSSSSTSGSSGSSGSGNKSSSGSGSTGSSGSSGGSSSGASSGGSGSKPKVPKPAYGTVTTSNPYTAGSTCDWEHGEYYYEWSEENNSWTTYYRFGMSVTDRDRWLEAAMKAFPYPNRTGKPGETINKGIIWIYLGGACTP